jgi:hypothetical protein
MTEVARLIDGAEMRATIQQRAALFSLPQSNRDTTRIFLI